jgi:hypothetical protein
MARKPFSEQEYTTQGAASLRPYEENTGTNQSWKPQHGQRTNEAGGWGGKGYRYNVVDGVPYAEPGSRLSDADVERYRQLGARRGPAVQLDQTDANRSKGLQMGSLARLQSAAAGHEPSRAAMLGKIGTEDALRASRATGRGPGGSLAAMRGSLASLSNQAGTTAANVGDMRAQEMTRNRGEFFGGGSGMRKQDIGAAVTNAQLDAANRDLEQRRQLQMEQLAWDTRNAEMFGSVEQRGQEEDAWLKDQQLVHEKSEADRAKMNDFIGAGVGMMAGAMASDNDTKNRITYGSLAGMGRRR